MANIKSQEKRIKTNERRRLRNKSVKSSLHDKAASKGVIHKNQAANRKSALSCAFNKI